jgi:hypothetical protein
MIGMAREAMDEATGSHRQADSVLPRTGGPAGNARLTAWTGLLLLALFVGELVTLLDVRGLITWHLVIGVLLVPPALLKTASTGWRIARYYTGNRPYRDAGPPSPLLRALGPLVVVFTLGLLASGLALVVLGPDSSRTVIWQVLGQRVNAITIHQAMFIVWAAVTGLHVVMRLVPALKLTVMPDVVGRSVPGAPWRRVGLAGTVLVAAVTAALVLAAASDWRSQPSHPFGPREGRHALGPGVPPTRFEGAR